MSTSSPLRIATRSSRLALWQAEHVADLIHRTTPEQAVELVHVSTHGDRDQAGPLTELGGQGVFTREVQRAVLDGRADLAVHSLKDLPTEPAPGLRLAAVPARAAVHDVLALPHAQPAESLDALPQGGRVGTGSLRRQAQLKHARPDLETAECRGNVETRLRKLDEGRFDAIVLAEAGLERLGLETRISLILEPPLMYPAVGQGAIGVECRDGDAATAALLARITDAATLASVTAERALLAALRAGCHAPVGVFTRHFEDALGLEAVVLSGDGGRRVSATGTATPGDAATLGDRVAADLLAQGADGLIAGQAP